MKAVAVGGRELVCWAALVLGLVPGPTVDAEGDEQKRCAELLVREVLPAFAG
ncbi:MAG: hypothetical protein OXF54_22800 [Caldilineaceae bacterium]|nr:hypothetical protein [Caldilineaceae bacterium]